MSDSKMFHSARDPLACLIWGMKVFSANDLKIWRHRLSPEVNSINIIPNNRINYSQFLLPIQILFPIITSPIRFFFF